MGSDLASDYRKIMGSTADLASNYQEDSVFKTEYIVVTDKTSEVLKSTTDRYEAIKFANAIRRADGEVTIFKSTKL